MEFKTLQIENFLTIGEAKLSLSQQGLVLVQGENDDDASANSNGAGKSSIADALCWVLYGKTARNVSGDAVINITKKKGTRVAVAIEEDGAIYVIQRHRKHSKGKNRLLVFKREGGRTEELTLGTDKLTQAIVERIVGCSYEVFTAAVYAGQDAMPDLPSMTDKMLKSLIEEAAGITRLQDAYDNARGRLKDVENSLNTANITLQGVKGKLESEKANEANLIQTEQSWITAKDRRLSEADDKIRRQEDEIDGVVSAIKTPLQDQIADLEAQIADVESRIAGSNAERDRERGLQSKVSSANSKLTASKSALTTIANSVRTSRGAIEDIQSRVGQACGECGKLYEDADIEKAKALAIDELNQQIEKLKECKEQADNDGRQLESVSKELSEFQSTMTDISSSQSLLNDLRAQLKLVIQKQNEIANMHSQLQRLQNEREAILKETNPYMELIEKSKKGQAAAEKEFEDLAKDIESIEESLAVHKDATSLFSPAGVRAHILDTVTPYLNQRTSAYLGTLSDGNLTAEWSTIGYTTTGDAREKFNIAVSNGTGADTFAGLSGGEKRKVRLACAMALQDLVASRAVKPINLFVADEIDHALDVSGMERLMGILDEKAKQRGTVLVISHNDLADWCRQIATVKKQNGVASVTGALI